MITIAVELAVKPAVEISVAVVAAEPVVKAAVAVVAVEPVVEVSVAVVDVPGPCVVKLIATKKLSDDYQIVRFYEDYKDCV